MRPQVIHINQAPKNWENSPNYIYIGRKGRGFDGYFGNHHPVGVVCPYCSYGDFETGKTVEIVHRRGEGVLAFERDLRAIMLDIFDTSVFPNPTEYLTRVKMLSGKTLVCFCKPNPCHGDILAQVCQELNQEGN